MNWNRYISELEKRGDHQGAEETRNLQRQFDQAKFLKDLDRAKKEAALAELARQSEYVEGLETKGDHEGARRALAEIARLQNFVKAELDKPKPTTDVVVGDPLPQERQDITRFEF